MAMLFGTQRMQISRDRHTFNKPSCSTGTTKYSCHQSNVSKLTVVDVSGSQAGDWGITVLYVPFNLVPNLHRLILCSFPFIPSQLELLGSNLLSLLRQFRNRGQIKIGSKMPKQGTRDTNQRSVRVLDLALLNDLYRLLIHDDLVEPGFDEAAGEMLDLLSGLNQEIVARWDLDGDAIAGVACPDVQAWVARAAVDGEEVEISVETC